MLKRIRQVRESDRLDVIGDATTIIAMTAGAWAHAIFEARTLERLHQLTAQVLGGAEDGLAVFHRGLSGRRNRAEIDQEAQCLESHRAILEAI
jgi:hypothetical protein